MICKFSCLYGLKRYQEIIDLGQNIPDLENDNIKLYYFFGLALAREAHYSEADIVFGKIKTLEPENTLYLLGQAEIFYCQQDYSTAIEIYQQVIQTQADEPTIWYNMACCYSLQQKAAEAIAALKKAIAIEPKQTIELIRGDEDFISLKDEQEFQNLLILD